MRTILAEIRRGAAAIAALAVLLCGIYPLVVWAVGQTLFPRKANGSMLESGGRLVGSELVAQAFTGPGYFHPRPSAAGHDAADSGGTNLGPLSKKLLTQVEQRVAAYRAENSLRGDARVPADAVTASASGLDPHISPENAKLQSPRVAAARGLPLAFVEDLVAGHTRGRDLAVFGEPTVNVAALNLALDAQPVAARP